MKLNVINSSRVGNAVAQRYSLRELQKSNTIPHTTNSPLLNYSLLNLFFAKIT